MGRKNVFQVGDVIQQRDSKEEGRIVRIVNHSDTGQPNRKGAPKGIAYIVSLPANQHPPVREAMWGEEEIAPAASCGAA
jgi:hypothetical protein